MAKPRKPDALLGRVIGERYRIVERIGAGAMATIYRAQRTDDELEVAVKVVLPKLAKNRTVAARIQREAKAATKLDHPGCVKIYDWGVDGETLYIAMELIEGEDVFELIQREKRLTQVRAVDIALDVLDVLASAHAVGVVHRDLKPENIMLMASGPQQLKILDFGIAKLIGPDLWSDETVPEKLTRAGSAVGTPSHMAPEQARGIEVDGRADIYACGVLLYETISGHLPFEGKSPIEVAVKQVRDPPRPPSDHFPELNPELERIILRCLEKDPAARWHSAEALADQLRTVRPHLPNATHVMGGDLPASIRPTSGTLVMGATPAAPADQDDDAATLEQIPPHLRALMDQVRQTAVQGGFGGDGDDDNMPTLHYDGSAKNADEEVTRLDRLPAAAQPEETTLRRPVNSLPQDSPKATLPHGTPRAQLPDESITEPKGALVHQPATSASPAGNAAPAAHQHYGSQRPPAYVAPPAYRGSDKHSSHPPAKAQVVLSTYGTQPTRSSRSSELQAAAPSSELDKLLSTVPSKSRKWLFTGAVILVMLVVIAATFLLVR